jgi:hypothetical protein
VERLNKIDFIENCFFFDIETLQGEGKSLDVQGTPMLSPSVCPYKYTTKLKIATITH